MSANRLAATPDVLITRRSAFRIKYVRVTQLDERLASTIVTHLCYSAMARYPHCCRSMTGSLHKHLPVCPLNILFLAKRSSKSVTPTSLKQKALRQVINTSGVAASLSADIHSASASAPLKHLRSLSVCGSRQGGGGGRGGGGGQGGGGGR